MLLKLAWKNIWRNPTRSFIVIFAVVLGLWLGIFMIAFVNGLATQRLAFQLDNTLAHIKVSHQEFTSEKEIKLFIPDIDKIVETFEINPEVKAISPRINFRGMATSKNNTSEIDIYGVNPKKEKATFGLYRFIKQGEYLDENQHKTIVIGQKLAKKFNLKLKDKIELNFQDLKGNLISEDFNIIGIYQITNSRFENSHVFVKFNDLQKILSKNQKIVHQVAIKIQDYKNAQAFTKLFKGKFKNCKVQSWAEVAPDLAYIEVIMQAFFFVFIGIILLGLSLGIINTMLMAILERSSELNMLKAIGMKAKFIFTLILLETFLLSFIGLPIGLALASLTLYIIGSYGIDLSYFSDGLAELGYSSLVYPHLSFQEYWQTTILLCISAFLAAAYPAWKALRLSR